MRIGRRVRERTWFVSRRLLGIVLFGVGLTPVLGADGPLTVEAAKVDPAPELSQEVRNTLQPEALRVKQGGQPFAEFWLRADVPEASSPSTELGVSFGQWKVGTLIGAVRFSAKWSDYKDLPILPGVYTLRYAIQPQDGAHMGVAMYRDFLLLIPAKMDGDPDLEYRPDELVKASSEAAVGRHPATLSLFPIYDEVTAPKLMKNDMDQWTLVVQSGSLTLGLVILGHGEIE